MRKVVILLAALLLSFNVAWADSSGVKVNEKGSSGVAVAVTTSAAVQVVAGDPNRNGGVTIYCSVAVNCEPGDTAGTAPATTPTTGAIGTGAGFPIPASTMVTILSGRSVAPGGYALSLPSGDRLDCISQSGSGFCATWSQQ